MIYLDKRPLHPSERIKRLTKNKKTYDVEFVKKMKKILPHLTYKLRAREQIQDDISKNIPVDNDKLYLKHEGLSVSLKKDAKQREKENVFHVIENSNKKIALKTKKSIIANLKQIKNRAINILRGKYGEDFVTD